MEANTPIKELKFTVPVLKSLIDRGYTFQELYAANYKTYRKEIGDHKIWLWVKDQLLEINDWHQHTGPILEFYKANLEKHIFDNKDLPKPSPYMKLKVKEDTSEVSFKSMEEYYMHLMNFQQGKSEEEKIKIIQEYNDKWEDYREVVIYIPSFAEVLKEVEFLCTKTN